MDVYKTADEECGQRSGDGVSAFAPAFWEAFTPALRSAFGGQQNLLIDIPWNSTLACDRMLYCDNKFLADE